MVKKPDQNLCLEDYMEKYPYFFENLSMVLISHPFFGIKLIHY